MEWISSSPDDTRALGALLGQLAYEGLLVLLEGDLGVGKTCFAQGVGLGLEVNERVKSPSFVLANEYEGRLPLYHLDLYRLEEDEIFEMGLSEYIEGSGVTLIEWAERARSWYPSEYLRVIIQRVNDTAQDRRLMFQAQGPRAKQLVSKMRERIS